MISSARRRIVFRSIKSALLKGLEVEYWSMRMYEQLEAGVLTSEQVEELEGIVEAYYDALDAAEAAQEESIEELEPSVEESVPDEIEQVE